MSTVAPLSLEFSLIVATSGRPRLLAIFLESLAKHGWLERADIEVIVVANPAPDFDTARVCGDYPKVAYVEVERRGKCHALNQAIPRSRGRFLAFTDDDVVVRDSEWLDQLASHFKTDPTLGYVSGQVRAFQTTSDAQRRWEAAGGLSKGEEPRYWSKVQLAEDYRTRIWPLFDVMAGANCMIPRLVLDACGPATPWCSSRRRSRR